MEMAVGGRVANGEKAEQRAVVLPRGEVKVTSRCRLSHIGHIEVDRGDLDVAVAPSRGFVASQLAQKHGALRCSCPSAHLILAQ